MSKPRTDLTKCKKSFAAWCERNYAYMQKIRNKEALREFISTNMDEVHVSDEYLRKFFLELDGCKSHTAAIQLITNKILFGAGMGVVGNGHQ